MKTTAVVESLSYYKTNVLFQRIPTYYNDIPVKIPSHPYVMVNRSVLCNCGIEVDNHYLLESLAAYDNKISKLTMYFTINTAFTNYLVMSPNLTDSLQIPLIKNRTTYEQTMPITLNVSKFDRSLLHVSMDLKDFMGCYTKRKEIFDLQERHDSTFNTNKNSFQTTTSWTFSYLFLL